MTESNFSQKEDRPPDMEANGDPVVLSQKESAPGVAELLMLLVVCIGLAIAGCGGGGGGGSSTGGDNTGNGQYDDGDDDQDTGDDMGDDGAIEPTLASIQENVFTPICTQCHIGASAPEGLRLEDGVSYGMLVNVPSNQEPSLMRVEPGSPDDSYLVHKIEGTNSIGERMPLGGPYLDADTIAAIRQWITDGASETAVATSQRSAKTQLVGGWPMDDSTLAKGPANITLIADGELDSNLLHSGSVQLLRLDDMQLFDNVTMTISSLSPTVINLSMPAAQWTAGMYEVRVMGSGATPVANRAGFVIDGDADGEVGGDFVLAFSVEEN